MSQLESLKIWFFLGLGVFTVFGPVTSAIALILGMAFALSLGNPLPVQIKKFTPLLLQSSVVGLGAGMNLNVVGQVGLSGLGYTFVGIALSLGLGLLLGRLIGTDRETSVLISVGTAICGGSAIAAVAPAIRAKNTTVSVSLATVFFLNASALLFFPALGHRFELSQIQFGLFSALAVHDTSSVVGTAMQYGSEALQVATPVKLARALWIVPVTLFFGLLFNRDSKNLAETKTKKPWFILGFLIAAAVFTWLPQLQSIGINIAAASRRLLVLTLFLIGSGLTRATLSAVGFRPFVLGVVLWALVASGSLFGILQSWVS